MIINKLIFIIGLLMIGTAAFLFSWGAHNRCDHFQCRDAYILMAYAICQAIAGFILATAYP